MSNKPELIRLQKLIANAGYCSRREAERLIEAGQVSVNGQIVTIGTKASIDDKIRVDGVLLKTKKRTADKSQHQLIALHKPIGYVCTRNDPQGRKTVFELLPRIHQGRWIQVGRLDVNTSGLLLFTTDGELAHRLMHPSYEIEREYAVRVLGKPSAGTIKQLLSGVELDDGNAKFNSVEANQRKIKRSKDLDNKESANHWFHVMLKEGRKREVRRLWEAVGHPVNRLIRVRYANIRLHRETQPGKLLELKEKEIHEIKQLVGLN